MTSILNLIMALIIFTLIIIYKIYQNKKYKESYKGELYDKSKRLIKLLYLLSIIVFIIMFIINLIIYKDYGNVSANIKYLINALSVALLVMPLSIHKLYLTSFKDEEKYSHIKTIVTTEYNEKIIKKFNRAGINVLIITEKKIDTKIKTVTTDEFDKKQILKTLIIKTSNKNFLNKMINKENTISEFKDLNNLYNIIKKSRGTHDNYIRTLKYLIITYTPLVLSYIFLSIMGFPVVYNILLILLLKVFTIITSDYLYKYLPYDTDIMTREVKPKNILIGKQEILLCILTAFCIFFTSTFPYMFTIAQDASQELSFTLLVISYIYSNIFLTISLISESPLVKNLIKNITNWRIILYIIICIAITLLFNFTTYFGTRNIELQNYLVCIGFGLAPILIFEITKLARYTSMKGPKKNESKNNKKQK